MNIPRTRILLVALMTSTSSHAEEFRDPPPDLVDVPGYRYIRSDPGVNLLEHAVRNSDGTLTIAAHMHNRATNAFHQQYCQAYGGVDITDETDITIGPGNLDAVTCLYTGDLQLLPPHPNPPIPGVQDQQGRLYYLVPEKPSTQIFSHGLIFVSTPLSMKKNSVCGDNLVS